jgi:hypothetical protein
MVNQASQGFEEQQKYETDLKSIKLAYLHY